MSISTRFRPPRFSALGRTSEAAVPRGFDGVVTRVDRTRLWPGSRRSLYSAGTLAWRRDGDRAAERPDKRQGQGTVRIGANGRRGPVTAAARLCHPILPPVVLGEMSALGRLRAFGVRGPGRTAKGSSRLKPVATLRASRGLPPPKGSQRCQLLPKT
jgi:hypothetical protein